MTGARATDLKKHFSSFQHWHLEKWEMYGVNPDGKSIPDVWTDEENKAIDILTVLRDTIDEILPSLMNTTEEFRTAEPQLFERTLLHRLQIVGFVFFPKNAKEFVEALNQDAKVSKIFSDVPQ
jgi:hypothetical protein